MTTLLVGVSKQVTASLYIQSIPQCQQQATETQSSSRHVRRSPDTLSSTRRLHYSIEKWWYLNAAAWWPASHFV